MSGVLKEFSGVTVTVVFGRATCSLMEEVLLVH